MTNLEKRVRALEKAGRVGLPQVKELFTWLGESVPDPPEKNVHYIEVNLIRLDKSVVRYGDPDAPRPYVRETGGDDQGEEARTEEDGNR